MPGGITRPVIACSVFDQVSSWPSSATPPTRGVPPGRGSSSRALTIITSALSAAERCFAATTRSLQLDDMPNHQGQPCRPSGQIASSASNRSSPISGSPLARATRKPGEASEAALGTPLSIAASQPRPHRAPPRGSPPVHIRRFVFPLAMGSDGVEHVFQERKRPPANFQEKGARLGRRSSFACSAGERWRRGICGGGGGEEICR